MQTLKATRRARPTSSRSGWSSLTPAELQVARLVAVGLSNRAVAEELMVSPHTVNTHVRNAFLKLDVSSRVQLTRHVLLHDPEAF
ncbi:helix-turn-helix transcriptional regulator [Streptomyces sp. 549]|uniref:helix-turn-helix domain-containing protein n=1 Tax=Streptomyces sp. 549 TaxID=3049076 RepID=UPI0024C2B75B|nr:helix-turn-helix transcriptional regulator [Streptomyces sp. 549]MDK1472626.1 helix-turn-helix transcriptional regulator [Streptomyces sp. 549]